ncbi:sulfite exporter TauE/SafE family protein [Alkalilimnicola ehrlichii MLHE-1]|uniref:Cytochrome c biogenesis protein, transmembrane region n=1 Tax=Alkalilimnicola ehrlichii (strain ATCC BAA-1101 / DSM 17681 / MLHE-1) TaxID=187272 RepID=Q0AAK1_ALKEH|nr:sulfite exporter TauE/SafE family protein [Alkalilimnicola ehrlichii]ABI56136.1 cytochrome c biogenesis protein, transmembrane region [Alkalilimnicola ehrlichii MLHE-1]
MAGGVGGLVAEGLTGMTLPAALALGLVYGVSACAVVCLPFLGPVLFATGEGPGRAWRRLLPFSLGRIAGYAGMAGLSALVGAVLLEGLGRWPAWLLGGAALVLAGYLAWGGGGASDRGCARRGGAGAVPMTGGLFVLGLGMALNPACASLLLVLLSAAAMGSVSEGVLLGLTFGLGVSVGPFLVFGVVFAQLGAAVHQWLWRWRVALRRGAALLLGSFGAATVWL